MKRVFIVGLVLHISLSTWASQREKITHPHSINNDSPHLSPTPSPQARIDKIFKNDATNEALAALTETVEQGNAKILAELAQLRIMTAKIAHDAQEDKKKKSRCFCWR